MISKRVTSLEESVTIGLNGLTKELISSGKNVYNLTVGQLEIFPDSNFIDKINLSLKQLSSFQYTAAGGDPKLAKKLLASYTKRENINSDSDLILTNGAKSGLTNLFATLIDEGDEVLLLAPYWPTYYDLIKYYQGIPITVNHTSYIPDLKDLETKITQKTKLLILNSPNNPSGLTYSSDFMQKLATILKKYPNIVLVSDEIYYYLNYNADSPSYPYHFAPDLLSRTVIVDGISKYLAATGLRTGFLIGPKYIIKEVAKLQGQTTSNSCSLIQNALLNYETNPKFIAKINQELLHNQNTLKQYALNLDVWYPIDSAFYFILDFSKLITETSDISAKLCAKILSDIQVSLVPTTNFGLTNSARISLSPDKETFNKAIDKLFCYLKTRPFSKNF